MKWYRADKGEWNRGGWPPLPTPRADVNLLDATDRRRLAGKMGEWGMKATTRHSPAMRQVAVGEFVVI
jgi:hypothetical protein